MIHNINSTDLKKEIIFPKEKRHLSVFQEVFPLLPLCLSPSFGGFRIREPSIDGRGVWPLVLVLKRCFAELRVHWGPLGLKGA